jgi:hypothetical protein
MIERKINTDGIAINGGMAVDISHHITTFTVEIRSLSELEPDFSVDKIKQLLASRYDIKNVEVVEKTTVFRK